MQRIVVGNLWCLALCVMALTPGCSDDAKTAPTDGGLDAGRFASVAVNVTGPITGGLGKPFATSVVELASHGYVETEYFYAGDATAYAVDGKLTMDGKWQLSPTTTQAFKTRLLVRRPKDAKKFNGTVIVEWLNVSSGVDGDFGFMYNWQEILREGYAWVGVSAQKTGIQGGGIALLPNPAPPLKQYDAERYGSLSHPGDAYSFDIYTRAAQILRGAGHVDVLSGLQPERLLAYGESQSAMRLVSYVDGVHPLVRVFDGFFIHSRSASALPFDNNAAFALGGTPALIRNDLDEPVFQFQTETDVLGLLAFLPARQPDGDRLRTWEVAGTAHGDAYIENLGSGGNAVTALPCSDVNSGPQHLVVKAALHALDAWLRTGSAPALGEPFMIDSTGKANRDDDGNVLGGVRTPAVDVPVVALSGDPPSGSSNVLCSLLGHTTPFSSTKLSELYPTHDDYLAKVKHAAQQAQQAGFVLSPEADEINSEAEAAAIPN